MIKIPNTFGAPMLVDDGKHLRSPFRDPKTAMCKRIVRQEVSFKSMVWTELPDGTARFDVPIVRCGDVVSKIFIDGRPDIKFGFGIGTPCNITKNPVPQLDFIDNAHTIPLCKLSHHQVFISLFVADAAAETLAAGGGGAVVFTIHCCDFKSETREAIRGGKFSIIYNDVSVLFRKNNDIEIRPMEDQSATKHIISLFRNATIIRCDDIDVNDHLPCGPETMIIKRYVRKFMVTKTGKIPLPEIPEILWCDFIVTVDDEKVIDGVSINENAEHSWPVTVFDNINPFPRSWDAMPFLQLPNSGPSLVGKIVTVVTHGIVLGQNLRNRMNEGQFHCVAAGDLFIAGDHRKLFRNNITNAKKRRRITVSAMQFPDSATFM